VPQLLRTQLQEILAGAERENSLYREVYLLPSNRIYTERKETEVIKE
jgi:hypothetical protein